MALIKERPIIVRHYPYYHKSRDTMNNKTIIQEDVIVDIRRILKETEIHPSKLTVSQYRKCGGLYDGRSLRPLGGFTNILNKAIDSEFESEIKYEGIVKTYANLFKKFGRHPTMAELGDAGHTVAMVKHYFSSMSRLEKVARDTFPDSFFDVDIGSLLDDDQFYDRLSKTVSKHKNFVITTAVTGCAVDEGFLDSIKHYCAKNKAALLVLVASDPAHNKDHNRGGYGTIDNLLTKECIVVEDIHLNSNFFISTIKLSAKQINPTTGLSDIGKREGSFVFASPKQSLLLESTSGEKLPHVMMTTGAVTKPNYRTDMYMSERLAYIADKHHVMGAVMVTIHDNDLFSYTQIQSMDDEGSFVHLGVRYHPDGDTTIEAPEALVCGDWHAGSTDYVVRKCTEDIIDELQPNRVVVHDGFDGASINHHEEYNTIVKAQRFMRGAMSLEEEINKYADDLAWFASMVDKVIVVKSNHDEFLSNHYLRYAKYAQDPQNHYYALGLAQALMEGKDPLEHAVRHIKAADVKNVRWLKRDEDFIVAGIQLGAHGDVGPSGTRGTLEGMRRAYGNSISGHSHTPGIRHGARAVGTSTSLRLDYNRGPGSWLNTHALVYADGSVQLINIIDGRWH
jgi:hypothetical protein